MTDEQIVKAFKICLSPHLGCEDGCPFIGMCQKDNGTLYRAIIDLIKRQQAEIKEQDKAILNALKRMGEVRAEAVREFAEKLKSRIRRDIDEQGMFPLPYTKKAYDTVMIFINNLVKEMTEEKK